MKRKLLTLVTAATLLGSVLPVNCMAAAADIPEGTTISFWHAMGGVNGEALDYLVNKFNEENEFGITVDSQYQGSYDDAINKLKAAGMGQLPCDIVHSYEIGTRFIIDSGWIVPVQEYIDKDNWDTSAIEPNLLAYYTVDGKGEFYILRDMATKIITDAEKVMTNEVIDSEAHS